MRTLAPVFLSAVVLASCGGGGGGGSSPAPPVNVGAGTYQYIFGEENLPTLRGDAQANANLAAAAQRGVPPFVILHNASPPYDAAPPAPASWNPHYCLHWTSEEQMQIDVASGQIPSWVDCFSYDNEAEVGPPTPLNEQQDPPPYYVAAAALAAGRVPIFYPTAGLTYVSGSVYASAADEEAAFWQTASSWTQRGTRAMYGIQSQTEEADVATFQQLIQQRMADVIAVNSNVTFSVGVGDYASGVCQPFSVMLAAANAAPTGFPMWVNVVPNPGCTTAHDEETVRLIDTLGP